MTVYRGLKHKVVKLGRSDSPEDTRFFYMIIFLVGWSTTCDYNWHHWDRFHTLQIVKGLRFKTLDVFWRGERVVGSGS